MSGRLLETVRGREFASILRDFSAVDGIVRHEGEHTLREIFL